MSGGLGNLLPNLPIRLDYMLKNMLFCEIHVCLL